MHWRRMLFAGLPGVLVSGLIAFQPARSHAQANGTAYTVLYAGSADFSYTTGSGPHAGTVLKYHVQWSATADGADLAQDAQLALSTSTDRFPESVVGPLPFTTLSGTISAVIAGDPQGPHGCTATLTQRPGTMMDYAMSMGPYLDNGTYALGLRAGEMPLSDDYMDSDNKTDVECQFAPPRNAFHIDTFPNAPFLKAQEFQDARVPLIDVYPIDPSDGFDETRPKNFDYTGPALDPNGPPGTTTYVGKIRSTIEVKTYGPLVIQQ